MMPYQLLTTREKRCDSRSRSAGSPLEQCEMIANYGPQAVRLLQPGRIAHAADGRDRPACTIVGEAVVRIGTDGTG